MTSSSWLRTAACGIITPVLTDDMAYLGHYGYALRIIGATAERVGNERYADHLRAKAYHLRTLAR